MSLINNDVRPHDILEECSVLTNHLIVRQEGIECQLPARVFQLELSDDLSGLGVAVLMEKKCLITLNFLESQNIRSKKRLFSKGIYKPTMVLER